MNRIPLTYVVITPARNEESFIELTLRSMVQQTHRPLKWVIVSDGSTDRTNDIVTKYTANHDWIELVRKPERGNRDFAGKVQSFNTGYERVRQMQYHVIGNLDADLSFEADLFELLINRFADNPLLGAGGPPFTEGQGTYDFRFSSIEHVWGGCQMFRRKCYEDIGGYRPMKHGGIDVLAVLMARMKGWQTRTFPERVCFHHRAMGSALGNSLTINYRLGRKDYLLGRHPVWQFCRSIYQMRRVPFILGGVMLMAGYVGSAFRGTERCVPEEVIQFQRREQMARLVQVLRHALSLPAK